MGVVTVTGAMLGLAESLIRSGLNHSEIIDGFKKAANKALEVLASLVYTGSQEFDYLNANLVCQRLKAVLVSKESENGNNLSQLTAQACIDAFPNNNKPFNAENIRIVKIVGGSPEDSVVMKGLVILKDVDGKIKTVKDPMVAVYPMGIGTTSTENKGTVLIRNANDLILYSKDEEVQLEQIIKKIASSGTKVLVSGTRLSDLSQHFLEKYGLMSIHTNSKFELRRICQATASLAIIKSGTPMIEELGFARKIQVREIAGTKCTVLEQDPRLGEISTIILRGPSAQVLDNMQKAIDNAINVFKNLCNDACTVPAGGGTEIEIAIQLMDLARQEVGLEQYAIQKFAEGLEVIPRTLAENSGFNPTDVVASLWSTHKESKTVGLDIESGDIKDLTKIGVADLKRTKWWAITLLTDMVFTLLKIDHIIMAKNAKQSDSKNR